ARVRRREPGRLPRDLRRRRRDRAAHGCRPQGAARARRQRGRPVPDADGRRHGAVPCVVPQGDENGRLRQRRGALGENRPMRSAPVLMILASFLFASMGVCVKLASAYYPAGEIVFYRGLTGTLLLAGLTRW